MKDQNKPASPAGPEPMPQQRWNEKRRQVFLASLAETANVRQSAREVGLSKTAAYDLKKRDPAFARGWAEALDVGYSELELDLLCQAIKGTERIEETRDAEGKLTQTRTVRSRPHAMALRLLQAHRGEVFAFRGARAQPPDDRGDDVGARVRAQMDLVRARLLGEHGPPAPDRDKQDGADGR